MPDPISLAAAGPWAVVVAIGLGLALAFVKGWIVPGWIYKDERTRSDRIEAALTALTKTVESMADDLAWNSRDRRPRRDA